MTRYTSTIHKLFAGITAAFALCGCSDVAGGYPPPVPSQSILRPVMIVAHRGGMAYAPENTVLAMQQGEQLLADMLELDVQVRENEIIVLHDFSLERTTNCMMAAEDADAIVRDACDAGYWWRPGASTYAEGDGPTSFRGRGVEIPLLSDVLNTVSADVLLMIELKHVRRSPSRPPIESAVDTLVTLIVANSLEHRTWISSSDTRALARVETSAPFISTALAWGTEVPKTCEQTVFDSISLGFDAVVLQTIEPEQPGFASCVQLAQDAGLKVMFWIVNRPSDVYRLLPLKPDGLLTDFPACLAALLRDVRIENPYPPAVPRGRWLRKCG